MPYQLTKEEKEGFSIWIKALRNGQYPQTKNTLQDNKGYCCLGVACNVLISPSKLQIDDEKYITGTMPDDQKCSPDWLCQISDDVYPVLGIHNNITSLNDFGKYNFDEIADILELIYLYRALD